jgi:hypothetical protein
VSRVLDLALLAGAGQAFPGPALVGPAQAGPAYAAWRRCLAGSPTAYARCRAEEAAYLGAPKSSRFVDAGDVAMIRLGLRARAAADPVAAGSIGRRRSSTWTTALRPGDDGA